MAAKIEINWKLAIAFSVVLLLILVFSLKATKYDIDKMKFKILGKNKDAPYTECDAVKDPLLRDLCHWDLMYKGYHTDVNPNFDRNLCYSMESFLLSKTCLRLTYRPHMLAFMTSPFTEADANFSVDECSHYERFPGLYCSYLKASQRAKDDLARASEICNGLREPRTVGECKFFVAVSLTAGIIKNSEKEIAAISGFCSTISYPFWESECYYLLADEAGSLKYNGYSISLETIEKQCTSSRKIADFFCYDHLLSFLNFEDFKEMCSLVEDSDLAGECYFALGKHSLRNFDFDTATAMEECNKLDNFRNECIKGIFTKLVRGTELLDLREFSKSCGNLPANNKQTCLNKELSKKCGNLTEDIKNECFVQLGKGTVVHQCFSSVEDCFNKCSKLPDESREACSIELGKRLSWFSNFDIRTTINKCKKVSEEAKKQCFLGIGEFLGDNMANNAAETAELCQAFPEEYQDDCYVKVGERIAHNFKYNKSLAMEKCEELDKSPEKLCYEGLSNYKK